MSTSPSPTAQELEDGLVQLRFADDDGNLTDISAHEMAEVLSGLVEFTSDLAKAGALGNGMPPELRVRPPKEGSFIVEAVVHVVEWAAANPEATIGASAAVGGAITKAIDVGARLIQSVKPADFEYLDDGETVKVKWPDGTAEPIPRAAWDELHRGKKRTRRALQKIMAPLGSEADRLEIRTGNVADTTDQVLAKAPTPIVLDADAYRAASIEVPDDEPERETFETELEVLSVDFRAGEDWLVATTRGKYLATMKDDEFQLELDRGQAVHKGDRFDAIIQEVRTKKAERTSKKRTILKLTPRRRLGGDDGDGDTAQDEQSPADA